MDLQVSDLNGGNTASNHPGASRHPSFSVIPAKAGIQRLDTRFRGYDDPENNPRKLIQEAYPASVVAKSGVAVA